LWFTQHTNYLEHDMTPEQNAIIKAYIAADPVMSVAAPNDDGSYEIAALFNAASAPAYYVWRSTTPASDISNAIAWSALTPTDPPDGTIAWQCRSLACQGKQINIQTLIQGRDSIASSKVNIRSGLQDALTVIPSGVAGATVGGGWAAVKTAMTRTATLLEQLLTTGPGTTATPSDLVYEGNIGYAEISVIRNSA
jgi:hypothetical protein